VIKHTRARQVQVQLMVEAGCVRLVIEEDGIGFDPDIAAGSGGQGIRNIRARAEKIGARSWIE
jgi:signal transduction histidine kinase